MFLWTIKKKFARNEKQKNTRVFVHIKLEERSEASLVAKPQGYNLGVFPFFIVPLPFSFTQLFLWYVWQYLRISFFYWTKKWIEFLTYFCEIYTTIKLSFGKSIFVIRWQTIFQNLTSVKKILFETEKNLSAYRK